MTIAASGGGSGFFLIIIVAFLLLWLIVVRPQRKRQTQQREMLSDLRVGDEVLTAGGIYGTVSRLDEDQVTVEIAPKTEVRVARRAIAGVTREPEPGEDGEAGQPEGQDGERWRSAFDDEDLADPKESETSNEEKRG
ncbi:MAG TPA: preprotein translocase subunit YajC [Gaiellaceae bacterium]|nr:preprotein translocase subunit YajC [Gaiellaceae bacterium]